MVSKKDMLKVLTKAKLIAAARKKRIKVAKSWTKEKIAATLPFDVIRAAYSSVKAKKPAKKKKPVKRKVKKVKKKKPARKKKAKKRRR